MPGQRIASQVKGSLNAPPVYRPLEASAQAKLNAPPIYRPIAPHVQAKLKAPPVYRPVVAPAQAKLNAPPIYRPIAPHVQARLNAPPVYRPFVAPAQAKQMAPPVYRPREIESAPVKPAATSHLCCQPKAPLKSHSLRDGVMQAFRVLDSSRLLHNMPTLKQRPWFGYPYAVVGGANFPSQVLDNRVKKGKEFLRHRDGAVNIQNSKHSTLKLRVSDDNKMAIEDSDLETRQPKVFYAADAVINASNTQLQLVGSRFRLMRGTGVLRILPDWTTTETLYKVQPQYLDGGKKSNPDLAPQNCNDMAEKVTNIANITRVLVSGEAERAASQIAGFGDNPSIEQLRLLPQRYVANSWDSRVRSQRANQYALPDVGDAYMISTIGDGTPVPTKPGYQLIRDIESREDRELGWGYHYAGVVAQSGNDRITLENYARGDNRMTKSDPRWYFQMYGSSRSQSFHDFHKAKKQYANPVTVALRNPQLAPLAPTTDLQAEDELELAPF